MKKVFDFLKEYNKILERKETDLRAELSVLYLAHEADIEALIDTMYARPDGKATAAEIARLKEHIKETKKALPENNDDVFPLSVQRFDQLNRLDVSKAELTISELQLANNVYDLINKHLRDYVQELFYALEDWLDLRNAVMSAGVLASICADSKYPIWNTIRDNHVRLAATTYDQIRKAMVRGENAEKAAASVVPYNHRQAQARDDSVLYYEGTRTTTDTVQTVVEGEGKYFYSVYVPDGKACEHCRETSEYQKQNPVPMDEMVAGDNAPPFHPFCRCGVEIVW